jgi:LysM repeat protein
MDAGRIWLTRIVAPIAFLAAVVALVLVVQRALDGGTGSAATTGRSADTIEVTTDLVETATETTPGKKAFYRVKTGDTLEAIAIQFDTSVEALLDLNPGVDPLALEPGQRLRVS